MSASAARPPACGPQLRQLPRLQALDAGAARARKLRLGGWGEGGGGGGEEGGGGGGGR